MKIARLSCLSVFYLLCLPLAATAASGKPAPGDAWETRKLPDGGDIALVGGPGALQTFSLMCRGRTPTAVLVLAARQPATQPAQLGLGFGLIRVDLPLARDAGAGNVWYSDLTASPLPRLLSSQSGTVTVSLNGQPLGQMSLRGSTKASRAALGRCTPVN